ncbi:MAG: hypothetical protein ACK5Y7_02885 [Betaproteobacteria bacterium]|jgi:hypothetical protein|uniref:hypothetical protein n=1 Tax=Silanimonas sp. TaxID=1929290 RepID=UPI0022C9EDFF|nr:hypothetical protein [Silanimonas sp.]MCZ8165857.1 hypothetical protein [Silanimonas sp.]
MKTKLLAAVVLGLSVLSFNIAMAHGDNKPKHGGVVATASDLHFELVGTPTGALIYIDDHGKPMAPTGMSGKLTVLNGAEKSEATLAVAGDRLEAKGVKLAPGAKVVAALTTPAKKAITVRFTVK